MNKRLKKNIARESLILLATVLSGGIIFLLARPISILVGNIMHPENPFNRIVGYEPTFISLQIIGITISTFGYLVYLLIRFIMWAIKTLKDK